ncbi:short-chain specific acyl-CoA dehydrogenase, mitochondrial-like isoform X2 [Colias croceus]|uniref:short-chain specific acyl-CoA dehydrogenase, mitochondrial-like isoform X2 n=1 Tax=Colias crocea TaxID=72248 RepID=UPI001E27E6CD|nr:short-chain specific acyl-CoA dehydrogenase, mitochondrial-like isoform X2 [Colias croceus]
MAASALSKTTKTTANLLQCTKKLACRTFTTQLNDQQREVQELVRKFSKEHLKPHAAQLDRQGRFPFEQIKRLTDLGFMGACVDPEYGGLGHDYLSLAVAVEEISRGCASTGMLLSIHNFLFANLVNERGTPEQKEAFLRDFTKGSIGCFALSEPDAGSDVANIRTTAKQDGDHWILNGKKSWVTSAVEGSATVVFATFDPELKHKGIVCFLVPLDYEGVFRGKKEPIMGVRAATACDLTLEEVRIPASYMVGQPGAGFKIAMGQLDQGRIGIAAHAVGIAQAALDTAINYAKERVAFGKNLTRLPSVKDRLTDMCIKVETARLLTYRAATDVCTKNSAMAKYMAGRNAAAVADHCVQILGGRGLSTKYDAERHYRDARGTQIYGGVTDIQKRLVGHFLLKEHDAL